MLSLSPKMRVEQMWRASFTVSALLALCTAIAAFAFRERAPSQVVPMLVTSLAALAIWLALLALGKQAKLEVSVTCHFLITALCLHAVWVNHVFFFQSGFVFEPFAGYKLYALTVGLTAPPLMWVGLGTLVAAGVVPALQFLMLSPELRHRLPIQEPWIISLYLVVALVTYVARLRWYETQLRSARAEARARLLQQFAHLLLNAQHLANTPLQTIENAVAILGVRHPEQEKLTDSMKRALARVREVVRLFSSCDAYINWQEMELPKSASDFESRMKELLDEAQAQS